MKLKAFLSLVRIPTVFSSMSNAYAGYWIGGGRGLTPQLGSGVLAAGFFIMAGMALNDVADKGIDAKERPTRPIPSGAISLGQAWGISLWMMLLGLGLLFRANPISAAVGGLLCLAIFGYNFVLKGGFFGPAAMGLCRMLNLLTGISLTWSAFPDFTHLPKAVYLALFSIWAYIALVTYFARDEVGGNAASRIRNFFIGLATWFTMWAGMAFMWFRAELYLPVAWITHAMFLRGPIQNLVKDPSPKHTGQMIGALLRVVPLLDVMAMMANHVPLPFALAGALWIFPAFMVGKWFYST